MWRSVHAAVAALALVVLGCSVAALAWPSPGVGAASASRVLHLRPRTRLLVAANGNVVSDGRYVLVSTPIASGNRGTVTDEQTGHKTPLATPSNCTILDRYSPIGGPWVLATCYRPHNTYALFDIPTRSWRTLYASLALFAASPPCAYNNCSAVPVAVGSYWIQFYVNCVEHCYSPSYAFQRIQTGEVRTAPKGWVVGGHTIPDLGSPRLAEKLCSPLTVPKDEDNGLPGTFTFFGGYAISMGAVNSGIAPTTAPLYLEKCGSRKRIQVDPDTFVLAANDHTVLWNVLGTGRPAQGLLLPSLRPFTLTGPSKYDLPVLGSKHLFFETPSGRVWETRSAFPPRVASN